MAKHEKRSLSSKKGSRFRRRPSPVWIFSTRLLTDVTGPFYTLVLELTVPSLSTFETFAPRLFADKDWQENYQKLSLLVESGHREVFTVVE